MPQLRRALVDQRIGCLQLLQGDRDQRTVRLGPRQHHAGIGVARMNEQDAPPADPTPASSGTDRTGWSQPPAPQSPGPPGAFVNRPAAPPGAPLPPGAGSPLQPGPTPSLHAPLQDTPPTMRTLLL